MALPTRVSRALMAADPFDAIHREFDSVLSRFLGQPEGATRWAPYCVDVREDADHIYVEAELPGFKKEEIDITMENQTLTIAAERHGEAAQQKQGDYLLNERTYHRFLRSFTLPPTVDEKNVDARLQDGVLMVTLNKREETKPKKIQVG